MIGGLREGNHHFNSFTNINPKYLDIPNEKTSFSDDHPDTRLPQPSLTRPFYQYYNFLVSTIKERKQQKTNPLKKNPSTLEFQEPSAIKKHLQGKPHTLFTIL